MENAVASLRAALRGVWPRRRSYSGEALESLLTNLVIAGTNVLSGILLARLLGPERRGELAAMLALPTIVASLGQLGLHDAVIYMGGKNPSRVGRITVSAVALVGLVGVPILAACILITPWFLKAQSPSIVFASQVYLTLLFVYTINGMPLGIARALHRISLWNGLRVLAPTLWLLLVALFFALHIADPVRIALTYLAALLLLSLFMVAGFRDTFAGQWKPDTSLWPALLRYGLPLTAGTAPQMLNERIDQLLIAGALPPAELGLYAVAVSWSLLGSMPGVALTSVAFSKIAGMNDLAAQVAFIRKATWAVAATTLLACAGLAVATPFAVRWVFGSEFLGAIPVAWILLPSIFFRSVTRMLQVAMQGLGRPAAVMVSEWAGLVLLLPAMIVLIPRFAVQGAAWALVVASAASLIAIMIVVRRTGWQ